MALCPIANLHHPIAVGRYVGLSALDVPTITRTEFRSREAVLRISLKSMARVVGALVAVVYPMAAAAQLGGNHGNDIARTLGEESPLRFDASLDRNWSVHVLEYERLPYYQVSDASGRIHFSVIRDGVSFVPVLDNPFGGVSVPSKKVEAPSGAPRTVVYRAQDFEVVLYGEGENSIWAVEQLD